MPSSSGVESYSDDVLAKACVQRPINEEAWREFWRRFYPLVHKKVGRILSRFAENAQVAHTDDVVQLAFLKIFKTLPKYDPQKSPLTAFLNLIVSSTVLNQIGRSRGTQRVISLDEAKTFSSKLRSGEFGAEDLWLLTTELLRRVEPRKREVLLDLLEGQRPDEICRRYRITRSHLYTITYRFRRNLRLALKKNGPSTSD